MEKENKIQNENLNDLVFLKGACECLLDIVNKLIELKNNVKETE